MNILVVGGAGFIGHYVALKLEREGHDVTIFDNFTNYGIVDPIEMANLHKERLKNFKGKIIDADITSEHDCNKINTIRPDRIIHLASYPRAKIVNQNPAMGAATMINGLTNLLDAAVANDVKRFVFISSSMVYGDFEGGVIESAVCKPGNIYASFKLAGEQITKQYAKQHKFDYTIIRPSAVYGPRDVEDRVVSKFLLNAIADKELAVHGEQEKLDFSYVEDVANGIAAAGLHEHGANETFNITYGQDEFISDAAHIMTTIVNKGRIRIYNRNLEMPSRGYLSISKAETMLDYWPAVSIDDGFKIYYDWAKKYYSV